MDNPFPKEFQKLLDPRMGFKVQHDLVKWLNSKMFGTKKGAYFGGRGDMRRLLSHPPDKRGFFISDGQFLNWDQSFRAILISATMGAGKSSCYILPNIFTLGNASAIVLDPNGESFGSSSSHIAKTHKVYVMNFISPRSGNVSINPLLHFRGDPYKLRKCLKSLVESTVPGNDKYWEESATSLLFTLAACLCNYPNEKYINFFNLYHMLNKFSSDKLVKFVTKYAPDRMVLSEFAAIKETPDRSLYSTVSTARSSLSSFTIPETRLLMSSNTFSMDDLRKRKGVLYLIVPENRMHDLSPVLNIICEYFFDYLLESPLSPATVPLKMLLDEAGHLKVELDTFLTSARRRRVSLCLVYQSAYQALSKHGLYKGKIILNTISNHLILPGQDYESTKMYSDWLGTQIFDDDKTKQERSRPLMRPDELRTMDHAVLISGNRPPLKVKMSPYYGHKQMKQWAAQPPVDVSSDLADPPLLNLED